MGNERIGLVLTGGGPTGIAGQTGALLALHDRGFKPSAIVGLSAGSVVGGAIASGLDPQEWAYVLSQSTKADYWDPVSRWRMLTGVFNRWKGQAGLIRGNKLREFMRKHLPVERIEDCEIPFIPVSANISREAESKPRKGDLAQHIRASTAIPIAFRPEIIDGETYVDGGLLGAVPVDIMAEEFGDQIDRILVITTLGSWTGAPLKDAVRWIDKPWAPVRLLERMLETVIRNQKAENWESHGIPVEMMNLRVTSLDLDEIDSAETPMAEGRLQADEWLQARGGL